MPPTAARSISPSICAASLEGSSPSMPAASSNACSVRRVRRVATALTRAARRRLGTGARAGAADADATRGASTRQALARRLGSARGAGCAGFGPDDISLRPNHSVPFGVIRVAARPRDSSL